MVDGAMLRMGRASISAPICLADGHSADPRARACLGTSGSLLLAPSGYLASSGLQVPVQTRLWEAVVRWHLGWSLAHSAALLSASHVLCPALQLAVGDEQTPTSSICLYHLRTRVTLPDHPGHPVVSAYPRGAGGEAETWAVSRVSPGEQRQSPTTPGISPAPTILLTFSGLDEERNGTQFPTTWILSSPSFWPFLDHQHVDCLLAFHLLPGYHLLPSLLP